MINTIVEDFKLYFPADWKRAIKYWETSPYELCIKRDDGETLIFDRIDKTIRRLPRNIDDLSEEDFKYEFGRRLRKLLDYKRVTQEELAEMTGMSQAQISSYMTGRVNPSFYKVYKIAEALKCPIDRLWYVPDICK